MVPIRVLRHLFMDRYKWTYWEWRETPWATVLETYEVMMTERVSDNRIQRRAAAANANKGGSMGGSPSTPRQPRRRRG